MLAGLSFSSQKATNEEQTKKDKKESKDAKTKEKKDKKDKKDKKVPTCSAYFKLRDKERENTTPCNLNPQNPATPKPHTQ